MREQSLACGRPAEPHVSPIPTVRLTQGTRVGPCSQLNLSSSRATYILSRLRCAESSHRSKRSLHWYPNCHGGEDRVTYACFTCQPLSAVPDTVNLCADALSMQSLSALMAIFIFHILDAVARPASSRLNQQSSSLKSPVLIRSARNVA